MLILILINEKCPTGDSDRSKALTTMIFQIFWSLLRYVGQLCSFMCMCAPATCLFGCFSFEFNNFHQITEAIFQEFHRFHCIMYVLYHCSKILVLIALSLFLLDHFYPFIFNLDDIFALFCITWKVQLIGRNRNENWKSWCHMKQKNINLTRLILLSIRMNFLFYSYKGGGYVVANNRGYRE